MSHKYMKVYDNKLVMSLKEILRRSQQAEEQVINKLTLKQGIITGLLGSVLSLYLLVLPIEYLANDFSLFIFIPVIIVSGMAYLALAHAISLGLSMMYLGGIETGEENREEIEIELVPLSVNEDGTFFVDIFPKIKLGSGVDAVEVRQKTIQDFQNKT